MCRSSTCQTPRWPSSPTSTVCHREPYARSLRSFNGAGIDYHRLIDALRGHGLEGRPRRIPNPVGRLRAQLDLTKAGFAQLLRALNEWADPQPYGYAAMTRALLRWTQSSDAAAASGIPGQLADCRVAFAADHHRLRPAAGAAVCLGPPPVLQGGTAYPLQLGGFAPQTPVQIVVHSNLRVLGEANADERGAVALEVAIPTDLEPGKHELTLTGVGADGEPRTVEIPFEIAGDDLPSHPGGNGPGSRVRPACLGRCWDWRDSALPRRRERRLGAAGG